MKKYLLFIVLAFVSLNCSSNSVLLEGRYNGVMEMGFISVAPTDSAKLLSDGALLEKFKNKTLVTAEINNIAVSDTSNGCFDEVDIQGNLLGRAFSVYGPDMVIKYFDLAKIKYELPLGRSDLHKFAQQARWTLRPISL